MFRYGPEMDFKHNFKKCNILLAQPFLKTSLMEIPDIQNLSVFSREYEVC